MNDTEKLLGRPGTFVECYTVFDHNYGSYGGRLIRYGYVNAFFQNMYREDIFYCDEGFIYWSTSPEGENKKGYENFSQRFRRKFPTYVLDSTMHIRAGPETKVVNLKALMALFRSTDEAQW